MAAYIRSKITNSEFTDVTIEAKDSNAKLRQDGTFKLPIASGLSPDTPVGSIRYNDTIEKIEFKSTVGWQAVEGITDGLATEEYVDDAVETAINSLAEVARSGDFFDLLNRPTTLAGYGIIDDVASKFYVDASISSLVGGAPSFLNTLNEISTALNNDPNFYNNVVTQLSGKLNLSGGVMTGNLRLSGAPSNPLDAATKQYVDSVTGGITVNSTDDVPEGTTNLYFTNTRATTAARNALVAGTGVTYNSATGSISIGQAVGTTSNVTFNNLTANNITANTFNISATGNYTITSATNIVLNAGMEVVVNSPLSLPGYSTTDLDDLVVQAGTIAYDTTVNLLKIYDGTAWVEIEGGPEFSGSYNDLTDKPTLFSGAYADLTGKPTLFSGAYADLTGKPTIPTLLSQLTNDVGFISSETDSQTLSLVGNILSISNGNSVTINQFSGDYNDLTNIPDLSTKLDIVGGTMSGPLLLYNDPVVGSEAATKQYVDNAVSSIGGGLTNNWTDIIFNGDYDFTSDEGTEFENSSVVLSGGEFEHVTTTLQDITSLIETNFVFNAPSSSMGINGGPGSSLTAGNLYQWPHGIDDGESLPWYIFTYGLNRTGYYNVKDPAIENIKKIVLTWDNTLPSGSTDTLDYFTRLDTASNDKYLIFKLPDGKEIVYAVTSVMPNVATDDPNVSSSEVYVDFMSYFTGDSTSSLKLEFNSSDPNIYWVGSADSSVLVSHINLEEEIITNNIHVDHDEDVRLILPLPADNTGREIKVSNTGTLGNLKIILDLSTSNLSQAIEIGEAKSFVSSGLYWLPVNADNNYVPGTPTDWSGTPPSTITEAIDRLATIIKALNGGVGA